MYIFIKFFQKITNHIFENRDIIDLGAPTTNFVLILMEREDSYLPRVCQLVTWKRALIAQ